MDYVWRKWDIRQDILVDEKINMRVRCSNGGCLLVRADDVKRISLAVSGVSIYLHPQSEKLGNALRKKWKFGE